SLPIEECLPARIAALRDGQAAVLVAPTGAGKTTRVPPALRAAGIGGGHRIGMLERRRSAARSGARGMGGGRRVVMWERRRIAGRAAARRMAEENGWTLGDEVGYQIRFERRAGPD